MTFDEIENALVEDVKILCKKWRRRLENKVNRNGCGEASV